ncbi:MAG: spore coat U domain-containing protein [Burkholderiales bacterium]
MARRATTAGLAIGLALFLSGDALAGVGTSTLTARTQVNTNCTIATTAVAFGGYDPIGANKTSNLNSSGVITIACVKGTTPTIGLGLGSNATGSTRRMRNTASANFLQYELYMPSTTVPNAPCTFPGTTVWGNAGANLFNAGSAPSKNARSYNVCGTVPAGLNPVIGIYQDTVVATVNF